MDYPVHFFPHSTSTTKQEDRESELQIMASQHVSSSGKGFKIKGKAGKDIG
jgi:hypothetical protein